MTSWNVVRATGDARGFHAHGVPEGARRSVRLFEVERAALALGSTQKHHDVDERAARRLEVDVFNRSSGGGAVLLDPGGQLWIDVVIGRSDALWDDDVSRASLWLGEVWVAALRSVDVEGLLHRGPMVHTALSSVICFAGLAPGEVTVDGAKVVGVSQRRTRAGARFQCSVPLQWDVERHLALLAPGIERCGASLDEIDVYEFDDADVAGALCDAFIAALP